MKVKDILPKNSANVNAEIIEAWKKEYTRGIFEIAVNTDDELGLVEEADEKGKKYQVMKYKQKKAWFRKPTRKEIGAAVSSGSDIISQQEFLMRDCFLGGDMELIDDDDYFDAAAVEFREVQRTREAEIKKL
jgi:hypothetical protein